MVMRDSSVLASTCDLDGGNCEAIAGRAIRLEVSTGVNHKAFVFVPTISAPKEIHHRSFIYVGRILLQLRLVSFRDKGRKCHVVESSIP